MLPLMELVLNFLPVVRWLAGDESVIFQIPHGAYWLFLRFRSLGQKNKQINKKSEGAHTFRMLPPAMGKSHRYYFFSPFKTGFLNRGTTDILGQKNLCCKNTI